MKQGKETFRLEIREDNATGEIGVCLADLPCIEHDASMANDGYLIAHDLIEHVNSIHNIGGIGEELQAMGAIWNTRGQWGDIRRDSIGSRYSAQESIANDVANMWRDYVYGEDFEADIPALDKTHNMYEEFKGITELAEKYLEIELDGELDEEEQERCNEYKEHVIAFMLQGLDKSVELYSDSTRSNTLFYNIEECLRNELFNYTLEEWKQYELTIDFDSGVVQLQEMHECTDCGEFHLNEESEIYCEICLNEYMTLEDIERDFVNNILPELDQEDETLVNEAFNNWTDSLCKDGLITDDLYNTITFNLEIEACELV